VQAAAGEAPARAALAGNPSDGYGGRTLAAALAGWTARVEVVPAERPWDVDAALRRGGADALIAAAARRLERRGLLPGAPFDVRWSSTIPRQVGLGGSSALVTAALRALVAAAGAEPLAPDDLALTALDAETVELGIAAGPQDRVAQAHGGLTAMDFDPEHGPIGRAEPLDPALLPPLFVAWQKRPAESSDTYHSDLRRRHAAGDPAVHDALAELAALASSARDALLAGDHDSFGRCLDGSFDARRRMAPLQPEHLRMVEIARSLGACANYAGSGGAIVGTLPAGATADDLAGAFAELACDVRHVRCASGQYSGR
jgi:glucuronokinase